MAPEVKKVPEPGRSWLEQRAMPTKAVARHTLSGSNMEMLNEAEKEDAMNINVNNNRFELALARKEWQDRYTLKLPSSMKEETPLGTFLLIKPGIITILLNAFFVVNN